MELLLFNLVGDLGESVQWLEQVRNFIPEFVGWDRQPLAL
jgi:hypothetical protein